MKERLLLWESLEGTTANLQILWLVGGDFNAISNGEEKLGGLPVTNTEVRD